jgi:hypothetical protein
MKLNLVSLAVSLSFASLSMLAGCAADTSSEASDDDASELADSSEDAITGAPSNFGYFVVTRHDNRKCASPMCGGYFVKRVNQATTRCADGTLQPECYEASIELKNIGLSPREEDDLRTSLVGGHAVIKALQYKKKTNGVTLGTLKANEGWVGATGSAATGSFYRAADNGLRCIKAPCPSTTAFQLNGHEDHNIIKASLEGTATPASQESLDRAAQALGTAEGVIIAGGIALPKCLPNSNCGPLIIAQEFFLRVTGREGKGCGGRGSSSCNVGQFCQWQPKDICGAADAGGLCQYKPDFCPQVFKQVCGCDGISYSNACVAAHAGMSVVSDGPCKK